MEDIARLGYEIDSSQADKAADSLDRMDGAAGRADKSAGVLSRTATLLKSSLAGVVAAATGFALAFASFSTISNALSSARDFDAALAETSTLIRGTAEEMAFLEERARSFAKNFGGSAAKQVEAFYQAISAGASSVEDAAVLVETANKLATGGVTDAKVAVDALTNAVNAYSQTGLTAIEASDALFVGIKKGKTTADELASTLGQVIPISSALGVSFDETVAAVAALTTTGQSTAQAVTGLRGAMAAILKPTQEAQDVADALGISFDAQSLRAKGLAGFLEEVTEKTGGSQEAMAKLFGGIEGLNAVLALTSGGADKFAETLDEMAHKAGATEEAFLKVDKSLSDRLGDQLAIISDALLSIGQTLLAIVVPALEATTAAVGVLSSSMDILLSVMVAIAATQIPLLIGTLVTLVTNFGLATAAVTALSSVMTYLGVAITIAGGPIGIFLGLIAGAAAYFLLFRDNAALAEQGAYDAAAGTEALNSALGVFHQTAAPSAGKAAIDLANDNYKLADSAYEAAKAEFEKRKAIFQGKIADDNTGLSGLADFFTGQTENTRVRKYSEALNQMTEAERALEQAITDRKRAATEVTGSSFTPVTVDSDQLGTDIASVLDDIGVGGSGTVQNALDDRLETLMSGLQSEREALDQWRAEGIEILNEAYEQDKITKAEHDEAMLELEKQYQAGLAEIRQNGLAGALGQASEFFGELASLTQDRNSKLLQISKVFGAAQALVNTYVAASQALADPSLSFWQKFAAVAKVIAAGVGLVNAIKSGGSVSQTGGASGGSVGTNSPRTQQAPSAPQRVIIEMPDGARLSKADLKELFNRFYDENKDRGTIFQVAL